MKRSNLILAATRNHKRERMLGYVLAGLAGVVLGVMLGVSV